MLEQFLLVGFKLKDCWCKLVMMVLQQWRNTKEEIIDDDGPCKKKKNNKGNAILKFEACEIRIFRSDYVLNWWLIL